jgi:HlyD family secretion protein
LKKWWILLLLAIVAAVIGWGIVRKSAPPHVSFARVKRQTLISTLPTNGKVEPIEWEAVRAETGGLVKTVPVQEGQTVARGAVLARITDPSVQADLEAAQARVAEARANLAALSGGGKPAELADIDNNLARARFDLEREQKDADTLQRLQQKEAATVADVQAAQDKVRQTRMEMAGLEKRRSLLVAKPDVDAARARVQDAEAALKLAQQRAAESQVRAPIGGEVYGLAVRPGSFLQAGDLVANVGRLDRLRVRVYVDEPLLGRVAPGQPVTIKWEALPGKQWLGTVERMPASIQALGNRQVGEVACTIENPGRDLIPGTNVDAEIRTAVAENALVIPKEALRHDAAGDYVFVLRNGALERRGVKTGNSTVTLAQVTGGLQEGEEVALPGDTPLAAGEKVTAE